MHGAGNDYIYVDCFQKAPPNPEKIAVELSPRRFSVGSDGLILVLPSQIAHGRMRMFNADGSEGKMCGNGIRCVAKFLYDNGYVQDENIKIETAAGVKDIRLILREGQCVGAAVDMGRASFAPRDVPVKSETPLRNYPIGEYAYTALSMGNPHAVAFTENITTMDIETPGKLLQSHPLFPESVNVEFCEIKKDGIKMRVWERGSGETLACGTGACAAAAAAVSLGYFPGETEIKVSLLGGDLSINVADDDQITMTGDAKTVYRGTYELKD